ncbi:MAG TPA: signal recognition particle-docking protein FtsY, partial [bacterium]|nr:signal recognition particle-docking protein FtsY [bacterium]
MFGQGLLKKLKDKLVVTHKTLVEKAESLFRRHGKIDQELLDELEEALIEADVGVDTSVSLVEELREAAKKSERLGEEEDIDWLRRTLKQLLAERLQEGDTELRFAKEGLSVFLIVGVNGTGKTTAIGKLANRYVQQGKQVVLAAADTFRAAAMEQLEIWGERAKAAVIRGRPGTDPASIVYDAIQAGRARNADIVIIDTAGRLQTKANLMRELEKIGRVIKREMPEAPHETLLVLDATTGQNGLVQAKVFAEAVPLTGLILTKLDGTAKGGVSIAIKDQLKLPIKFIGVGEGLDDLEVFDK